MNVFSRWWRRFKESHRLPMEILVEPTPLEQSYVGPGLVVRHADDEKIVLDAGWEWDWIKIGILIVTVCLFWFGFAGGLYALYDLYVEEGFSGTDVWWYPVLALVALASLVMGIFSFRNTYGLIRTKLRYPERHVVFDRMRGVVTIPPVVRGGPVTVPFGEVRAYRGGRGAGVGVHSVPVLEHPEGGNVAIWLSPGDYGPFHEVTPVMQTARDWSFWVWYMDRNRPLPPGSALDAYRERDVARLRREGLRGPFGGVGTGMTVRRPGPGADDAGRILELWGNVLERYPEVEWASYGGVVYDVEGHGEGYEVRVKPREGMVEELARRERQLMVELLSMAVKHGARHRLVQLVVTERPRGRVFYPRLEGEGRSGP